MKHVLENERGSVMVWAAGSLAVFMLFAALALDVGRLWVHSAQLQAAADAAALAGAATVSVRVEVDRFGNVYGYEVTIDPNVSTAEAVAVLDRNIEAMGFDGLGVMVTEKKVSVTGLCVTVTVKARAPAYLLPILGERYGSVDIARTATAEYVP